ncbi:MAG: hypothetical protein IPK34_02940 [Ramlibacter sp.]|jgi:hypothetical protein|nr:hypothetical protein [Ramlibacter sp.]
MKVEPVSFQTSTLIDFSLSKDAELMIDIRAAKATFKLPPNLIMKPNPPAARTHPI